MNFDLKKFEKNIELYKVQKDVEDQSGFVNVISYLLNQTSIDEIDFDQFTLSDTLEALYEMDAIEFAEIDDETFIVDSNNPFYLFLEIDKAVYNLAISKDKHFEIENEDDFFI